MVALSHARELLDAAKFVGKVLNDGTRVAGIEIFPTDDLAAFKMVFSEYIQSPQYYNDNTPEVQQYLQAMLVRICQPTLPPDQVAEQANRKVWPMQPTDPAQQAQAGLAASVGAPQSGMELEANQQRMQVARDPTQVQTEPSPGRMGGM
jgi:hypothetical protein